MTTNSTTKKSENISDIDAKVKGIIGEKLGRDIEQIQSSSALKDLGADSLDTVEIVMALEEKFDIAIPDEIAEKVKTVEDVVTMIKSLRKSDDNSGSAKEGAE